MASPLRNVTRAAFVGLILGLVGAAIIFVANAVTNATRDCAFPGTEECDFELAEAQEISRLQSYAAIGCALVAGGLFLTIRRRKLS
jgi:hypothetical protein